MNIFNEADDRLDRFINNNLSSYHQLRNYDYGIENRSNVSQISKYTTHRILYEFEIIEKLKKFDNKKKFIDEILWRVYWRGYLESHKSIWFEYKVFKNNANISKRLKDAIGGKTGIVCFDRWIEELKENNYLHNHSRMWFASIWIFTLKLPWQTGARIFMKHLLDGDASSNTLSWRWVAGMHTNNKPYIATKENINKYTLNRFSNISFTIMNKKDPISTNIDQLNKLPIKVNSSTSGILLMFDNDMNIKNRSKLFNSYQRVYIICNATNNYGFELSKKVTKYKEKLVESVNNCVLNSEVIKSSDLDKFLSDYNFIDVIYPGLGHNLDLINYLASKHKIKINYIYRDEDLMYWNYAKSGFYKFKKSFYKINNI
tara:strand:+ start:2747 stop:3862 length:1116 start_codon:yes stop_codon:yes gene_type:complete